MELAAALHHLNDALRSQKTVSSKEEAVYFELHDEDTAGGRPAWQSRGGRKSGFSGDFAAMVQILDVPALPVVLGWVQDRILQRIVGLAFADDAQQEIAVPKILPRPTPSSSQMVEQLVDVPVVSLTD